MSSLSLIKWSVVSRQNFNEIGVEKLLIMIKYWENIDALCCLVVAQLGFERTLIRYWYWESIALNTHLPAGWLSQGCGNFLPASAWCIYVSGLKKDPRFCECCSCFCLPLPHVACNILANWCLLLSVQHQINLLRRPYKKDVRTARGSRVPQNQT